MKKAFTLILLLLAFQGLLAQDFKFGKVSKEEVLEKEHPENKDADAAVLFREHKVYYKTSPNSGFTLVTEVHERIKIYNKDGFDWANKEIFYYQNGSDRENVIGIKGYTYNIEDGKLVEEKLRKDGIFDEEVNKYRLKTTLTMPEVKEGSVVEYQYTLESPFLISIDEIPLQYTIPINRLEAQVTIPEYLVFRKYFNLKSPLLFEIDESMKSNSFTVTSKTRSGHRVQTTSFNTSKVDYKENVYSITKEDIPALKDEAYVDYLKNYAAYMRWELQYTQFPNSVVETYTQSWESVTKTVYNDGNYARELGRNGFFEEEVDALVKGIQDPEQKVRLIYNFVRNKVKWNEFYGFLPDKGGRAAYKDGEGNVGDINLLLTAMLKYAGLNANPVLVSTQDNGIPLFPTRQGFNYLVSGLQLPDQFLLLDATDPNAALGELPERARNWQGRLITGAETSEWVNLRPNTKSGSTSTINLQFDENFGVQGKLTDMYNGFYAKSFREEFAGVNAEKYVEILEKDKGNISITDLKTENEKKIGETIKQSYTFSLQDEIEVIEDRVYFQPLLFEAVDENPFKAEERQYPISFNFPSVKETTVNILVPEGYVVESLPESLIVDLNGGAGSFKYLVHQNGQFLRVNTVVDLNNIFYSAADYKALKDFYGKIVEKQTEAIVLKRI